MNLRIFADESLATDLLSEGVETFVFASIAAAIILLVVHRIAGPYEAGRFGLLRFKLAFAAWIIAWTCFVCVDLRSIAGKDLHSEQLGWLGASSLLVAVLLAGSVFWRRTTRQSQQ